MKRFVGALDQGTTSTRFIVFDADGSEIARHQVEHRQILPRPGWVEHDPLEIAARTNEAMRGALQAAGLAGRDLAAIGIANQRETTVVWDPETGRPWCNAIVWQDTRTDGAAAAMAPYRSTLCERTGLPPSTYFSSLKLRWILDSIEGVRGAAERGRALFGTIDTWVIWNLTGARDGGRHVTDVTNASRTQLLNLGRRDWDDDLLALFGIPRRMLPRIRASSDPDGFGTTRPDGPLGCECPIAGVLGDQHAALVGQACFTSGDTKSTYGTGSFILQNTGPDRVTSGAGLLTTMGYSLGGGSYAYALEGSIAVTGAAVRWLRDGLGIMASTSDVEALAGSVDDSGGIYFVPAFSGLFAPYWRSDARGTIVGLTQFHTKAHLARATLEAICFQTRDVLDAMARDSAVMPEVLKVDGGATRNDLLMQVQADITGIPVVRPAVSETTALGGAYAAGLAVGVWKDPDEVRRHWKLDREWTPRWSADRREQAYHGWRRAVDRSLDWAHTPTNR